MNALKQLFDNNLRGTNANPVEHVKALPTSLGRVSACIMDEEEVIEMSCRLVTSHQCE